MASTRSGTATTPAGGAVVTPGTRRDNHAPANTRKQLDGQAIAESALLLRLVGHACPLYALDGATPALTTT
jgi:hypothetical protein